MKKERRVDAKNKDFISKQLISCLIETNKELNAAIECNDGKANTIIYYKE